MKDNLQLFDFLFRHMNANAVDVTVICIYNKSKPDRRQDREA